LSPDAADQLAAADRALAKASAMLTLPLHDEAGRAAYYAMFHAAQADVIERGLKPAKSHRGVRQLFARVAHGDPTAIQLLVGPPTKSYQLKWIADYDTSGTTVSLGEAQAAIADAAHFVATVRGAIGPPPAP
jgi:uncharacterized protein (UPF0332 family)